MAMNGRSAAQAFALGAVLLLFAASAGRAPTASAGPDVASVPEVVDLPEAEARALLTRTGFQVAVNDAPGEPVGTVASQQPGGFWWAARGSVVTIDVRRGAGA